MSTDSKLLVVDFAVAELKSLGLRVGDIVSVAPLRPTKVAMHRPLALDPNELVRFIGEGALRIVDHNDPYVVPMRTPRAPQVQFPTTPPDQWAFFPLTLIRGGAQ